MAEAPSLRISMRSTASVGITFRSANTFWPSSARPYGAMRRPLSSTSVEAAPRPRSEMPDAPAAKPLPKLTGTEPWLSTASVCSNSATVVLPERSMSLRFTVSTLEAVSAWARRMFEPVISTRAIGAGVVAVCWASAGKGTASTMPVAAAAPPPAKTRRRQRESRVSVMSDSLVGMERLLH